MNYGTTCGGCGSTGPFLPTRYRDVFGTRASLVRCGRCGLKAYDRVVASAEQCNDSPEAHAGANLVHQMGSMSNQDPTLAHQARGWVRDVYLSMLARLRAEAGALDSLYEVGASVGSLLLTAREAGVGMLAGCEPNRRAAEIARREGLDVEHAFFQGARPVGEGEGAWDAVAMLDVIEHTETPGADLARAAELLRPAGVLMLKTFYDEWHDVRPELDVCGPGTRPHWGDVRGRGGYFGPAGHVHHFDVHVLLGTIERVGLVVADVTLDEAWGQITVFARRPA